MYAAQVVKGKVIECAGSHRAMMKASTGLCKGLSHVVLAVAGPVLRLAIALDLAVSTGCVTEVSGDRDCNMAAGSPHALSPVQNDPVHPSRTPATACKATLTLPLRGKRADILVHSKADSPGLIRRDAEQLLCLVKRSVKIGIVQVNLFVTGVGVSHRCFYQSA